MRARPREINIFNMSLLDILCGALGAFCFMMLVALPYYKSDGDAKQNEQDILVILQELELLRQQVRDPQAAEAQQKLLERLKAELQQLQGERNQLAYENARLKSDNDAAAKGLAIMHDKLDQAEAENDQLEQANLEQKAALAAKKPFAVTAMSSDFQQPVDLYLERTSFMILGAKFERFNPAEPVHHSPEPDDLNAWVPERAMTFWVSANSRPGSGYRVFIKHLDLGRQRPERDATVKLSFAGNFADRAPTPSFTLSRTRPWLLAGVLKVDDAGKLSFKEATAAEQDDAWRQITKSEPPSATPTATPAAGATPVDREDLRRRTKEIEEQTRREWEEKRRQRSQPGSAPSASPPPAHSTGLSPQR